MLKPEAGVGRFQLAGGWPLVVGSVAVGGIVWSLSASWSGLAEARSDVAQAAWLVPGLVGLHLGQLFLSGVGWRALFAKSGPGIAAFYRLRIIREGIDSLLPVAQVGGEIVGARLLSRLGVAPVRAGASVIVDVTIELLTQVAFLASGLSTLAWLANGTSWRVWALELLVGAIPIAAALLLGQRFGLLHALEALSRGLARRWPAMPAASLDGLQESALGFYRQRGPLLHCVGLHLLAWMMGSVETWVVLRAVGAPVTPLQAFTVESLGMAARSAGFAIPAALGVQEGGFLLAGAAVGIAVAPALALSFVKRIREIPVGIVGLLLWRLTARRPARH